MASMESLVRKRAVVKGKLTSFIKYLDKTKITVLDSTNKVFTSQLDIEFNLRINALERVLDEYSGIQNDIDEIVEDVDAQIVEREEFEDKFFSTIADAKSFLNQHVEKEEVAASTVSTVSQNSGGGGYNQSIRLPTISLPKFDGAYNSWLEFRDSFDSLINQNEAISPIQRFHYLRASLTGGASQVIQSLEFSANNYDVAWNTLCQRYNNNRLLIHNHVKALFSIEIINKESSNQIRKLIDAVNKHLRSLETLKQNTSEWDTLIVYLISTKLDSETNRGWESYKADNEVPSLQDLKDFLKARADLLETLESKEKKSGKSKDDFNSKNFMSTKVTKCNFCKKDEHVLRLCPKFLSVSIKDRTEYVQKSRLCFNCLRFGHQVKACQLGGCFKCGKKHNTTLHIELDNSKQKVEEISGSSSNAEFNGSSSSIGLQQVLLSTAMINVLDSSGNLHTVKALLDSGSQSSYITSELAAKLNLKSENCEINVGGLNNSNSRVHKKCVVIIRSRVGGFRENLSCLIIPSISGNLPNFHISRDVFEIPQNIVLADPEFYKPSKISLLIGSDLFWSLFCVGQINLVKGGPVLQKSRLGWVIGGRIGIDNFKETNCSFSNTFDLQKFWNVEECLDKNVFSAEEKYCESYFSKTTERDKDGRFIVSIPFREDPSRLGESKNMAQTRFNSLEVKFSKNESFKKKYVEFMREYESMGHMKEVIDESQVSPTYFFPHHGVSNESSTTTTLRVVYNGSAKTSSGISLNDIQMVGPVIQPELFCILVRFRTHAVVLVADIMKMYRMVQITPEHCNLQRILWRENPSETLRTYELQTRG